MKNLVLISIILFAVISCGDDSKSTSPPAKKDNSQSSDSLNAEVNKENAVNLGLGQEGSAPENLDDKTKKLHEFADNKCKCGQQAFQKIGDIDKLSEDQFKEVRTKFKNCIGEFRTGEIIKIMDKNIVDSYMVKNCPQISSTFNRLRNRF